MSEKVRVYIIVSGQVQGVFFRDYTQKKAQSLEITGWVKNLPDGRVEVVLEGRKERINQMIDCIKAGPPLAKVTNLEIEWQKYQEEFDHFEIRY